MAYVLLLDPCLIISFDYSVDLTEFRLMGGASHFDGFPVGRDVLSNVGISAGRTMTPRLGRVVPLHLCPAGAERWVGFHLRLEGLLTFMAGPAGPFIEWHLIFFIVLFSVGWVGMG